MTTGTQGPQRGLKVAVRTVRGSRSARGGKGRTQPSKDTLPKGGTLPGTHRMQGRTLASQRLGLSHWLQGGRGRVRTDLGVGEKECQEKAAAKVVGQRSLTRGAGGGGGLEDERREKEEEETARTALIGNGKYRKGNKTGGGQRQAWLRDPVDLAPMGVRILTVHLHGSFIII